MGLKKKNKLFGYSGIGRFRKLIFQRPVAAAFPPPTAETLVSDLQIRLANQTRKEVPAASQSQALTPQVWNYYSDTLICKAFLKSSTT
ncbi:hypothetical protein M0R45_015412 [Rubus argutus]|uniref:Uncharacterized protein n=1 Tax=Rubus argutus TaxID=59490 RepID=A0AAW1XQP7_RUBAR